MKSDCKWRNELMYGNLTCQWNIQKVHKEVDYLTSIRLLLCLEGSETWDNIGPVGSSN